MTGYLDLTSAFVPIGWTIVMLTVAAAATLILRRERSGVAPTARAAGLAGPDEQTDRWAA